MVFFEAYTFFILMVSNVSNFLLVAYAFGVIPKKSLLNSRSQRFITIFSSKSFIALVLDFDQFWVHFCVWCEVGDQIQSFCMWISNCSSTICWRDFYSFPTEWSWYLCLKLIGHRCMGFSKDPQFYSIGLSIFITITQLWLL